MKFLCNYMDKAEYRCLLSEMTGEIFGFFFEDWYNAGYFEGAYIPYSFVENGKIISNASANIMRFVQNGEEKRYIQIGTVMTRPEYRNRGLARELIQRIINDYAEYSDGFYLYGNLNAVNFYAKLGFQRLDQWRWSTECREIRKESACFVKVEETMRSGYVAALKTAVENPVFDHLNRASLQLFYTGNLENVYFQPELNAYIVYSVDKRTLYLDSVISDREVPTIEILKRINEEFDTVILGFTPRHEEQRVFSAAQYDGADDYRFFYKGDALKAIQKDKLYFPVMSHA